MKMKKKNLLIPLTAIVCLLAAALCLFSGCRPKVEGDDTEVLVETYVTYTDGMDYNETYLLNKCDYDTKGNRTRQTSYDRDGNISSQDIYEYDDSGNTVKQTNYGRDGKIASIKEHKYLLLSKHLSKR